MGRRVLVNVLCGARLSLHAAKRHRLGQPLHGFMMLARPSDVQTLKEREQICNSWKHPTQGFHAHVAYFTQKRAVSSSTVDGTSISSTTRNKNLSEEERRRLLSLVDTEDLRKRLLSTGHDFISFQDAVKLFREMGVVSTDAEASAVLHRLNSSGVILLLRNIVFVRPDKVAQLMESVLPLTLRGEHDEQTAELRRLEHEKARIDEEAHRKVRRLLWISFGALSLQSILFFRLTFWDLSWDVMEPITFFVSSTAVLAGLLFFIYTRREPSYVDFLQSLYHIAERGIIKKRNFDLSRLEHLQRLRFCGPPPPSQHP
ncbi:hypothetical protein KP509_19G069100 [Ceratopteris richardii]|uniref:Calcium uniporter protein C-terminal domain-containing protein n=1 Tax=Ceratopteris richardii TaxID=49495 RepID=A0A8T2SM23_CERRI|nr:hypothetical protein KP509_19G069100 [Ceratopteris richardii]